MTFFKFSYFDLKKFYMDCFFPSFFNEFGIAIVLCLGILATRHVES